MAVSALKFFMNVEVVVNVINHHSFSSERFSLTRKAISYTNYKTISSTNKGHNFIIIISHIGASPLTPRLAAIMYVYFVHVCVYTYTNDRRSYDFN